jgi:hypothetical protein
MKPILVLLLALTIRAERTQPSRAPPTPAESSKRIEDFETRLKSDEEQIKSLRESLTDTYERLFALEH